MFAVSICRVNGTGLHNAGEGVAKISRLALGPFGQKRACATPPNANLQQVAGKVKRLRYQFPKLKTSVFIALAPGDGRLGDHAHKAIGPLSSFASAL